MKIRKEIVVDLRRKRYLTLIVLNTEIVNYFGIFSGRRRTLRQTSRLGRV